MTHLNDNMHTRWTLFLLFYSMSDPERLGKETYFIDTTNCCMIMEVTEKNDNSEQKFKN